MSWLALALLAPLLFAIGNLLDDNLLHHAYRGAHIATIVSGLFSIVPVLLIIAFGANGVIPIDLAIISILTGFMMTTGYYLYFKGLEREEPSVVVAIMCLSPAIIPFIAYFLVDERLTSHAIIGFTIVIVAGLLYSLSNIRTLTFSAALLPVLAAALIFDISALANKYVYTNTDFYPAYLYYSIGVFVGGLVYLGLLKFGKTDVRLRHVYQKNSKKIVLLLTVAELLVLAAGFATDRALSLGSISLVVALGNLQPFYVLMIATVLYPFYPKYFREAESGRYKTKLFLMMLLVAGAYIAVK